MEVSTLVQLRFLKSFLRCGGPEFKTAATLWLPLWHGTQACHKDSICKRGLLTPGSHKDVRVLHGSAHGLGVYTARVEAPWLSHGFASPGGLLVCAGLDDAVELSEEQRHAVGGYTITRESAAVRHVGDAVVFFDHKHVAPLFSVKAKRPAPKVQDRNITPVVRAQRVRQHTSSAASARRCNQLLSWVFQHGHRRRMTAGAGRGSCLLYTSDAADDTPC
eukprot:866082-Amphidinium_carterae.1